MLNWAKLVADGRAKAINTPWDGDTDTKGTEAYARLVLEIPADYVRAGVLTLAAYEEAQEKGLIPKETPSTWGLKEVEAKAEVKVAKKKSKKSDE